MGRPRRSAGARPDRVAGVDAVARARRKGEGSGLNTRAFVARASNRVRQVGGWRRSPRASSRSVEERGALDGQFGRCVGCGGVHVFCRSCAAVGASCVACADAVRRAHHRRRNRAWSKTPAGVASNLRRQARSRARRRRVTDATLSEEVPASTSPSPSSSASEPAREKVTAEDGSERDDGVRGRGGIGVVRCARCGRTLSGRTRPSEWTPPRRSAVRAPRQPRAGADG